MFVYSVALLSFLFSCIVGAALLWLISKVCKVESSVRASVIVGVGVSLYVAMVGFVLEGFGGQLLLVYELVTKVLVFFGKNSPENPLTLFRVLLYGFYLLATCIGFYFIYRLNHRISRLKTVVVFVLFVIGALIFSSLQNWFVNEFVVTYTAVDLRPTYETKNSYRFVAVDILSRTFERGDLIVFLGKDYGLSREKSPHMRRIVGMPGENVAIRDGRVYVNDQVLQEPHAIGYTEGEPQNVHLSYREYYVIGDNREQSRDSRTEGSVHEDDIVGIVVHTYGDTSPGTFGYYLFSFLHRGYIPCFWRCGIGWY